MKGLVTVTGPGRCAHGCAASEVPHWRSTHHMSEYIDVQGCLTFWVSGDGVSRARLRELLAAEGVRHTTPRARQPLAALKRAVHEALELGCWPRADRRQQHLVRPLPKRSGYALVTETPGLDDELHHVQAGSVTLVRGAIGDPLFFSERAPQAFRDEVRRLFAVYQDLLSRSALSDFLCSLLSLEFGATSLRPSGGLYQFRESLYDPWLHWVAKIQECVVPGRSSPVVYTLKHAMDEQAARAVLDGLRREVRARAADLKAEVTGPRLGAKGKAARRDEAYRLKAKVQQAESLLNEHLPDLKAALDEVASLAGGLEVLAAVEAARASAAV